MSTENTAWGREVSSNMPSDVTTPSQPKNEPAATPITMPTTASSIASASSINRSDLRCMPRARSSADSRCRSITDRPRVLPTPTRAITTATPSSAVSTMRSTFTICSSIPAMVAPPPISTSEDRGEITFITWFRAVLEVRSVNLTQASRISLCPGSFSKVDSETAAAS